MHMMDSIGDQTQTSERFEYRVWVPVETLNGQTVTIQAGERDIALFMTRALR